MLKYWFEDAIFKHRGIIAASPPYAIDWSPSVNDATNPTNLSAGIYNLLIRDDLNCVFMDSIIMENPTVFTPACINNDAYVPNVFSPNGDGINDFFELFLAKQTTVQQVIKVEIIDRWGNLVYFSESEMPKWDGLTLEVKCQTLRFSCIGFNWN